MSLTRRYWNDFRPSWFSCFLANRQQGKSYSSAEGFFLTKGRCFDTKKHQRRFNNSRNWKVKHVRKVYRYTSEQIIHWGDIPLRPPIGLVAMPICQTHLRLSKAWPSQSYTNDRSHGANSSNGNFTSNMFAPPPSPSRSPLSDLLLRLCSEVLLEGVQGRRQRQHWHNSGYDPKMKHLMV